MPKNPGKSRFSGVFLFDLCCSPLRKFDAIYAQFDGLISGENPFWTPKWAIKRGKNQPRKSPSEHQKLPPNFVSCTDANAFHLI
jgi:hypothetical protein